MSEPIPAQVFETLKQDEGLRLEPYRDSLGILTIGYGHNLESNAITQEQAEEWLREDYENAIEDAKKLDVYHNLSGVRRGVLISMVFQMGLGSVKKFRNTLRAMMDGDFHKASNGMLGSKWARQTPRRAQRMAQRMAEDRWEV